MFSFENIYRQYLQCRRNKRNTLNALNFEVRQEENLLALKEALDTRAYRPSRSVCFIATKPKLREIFAADFRDRIVHHILVDYLEKIWEPVFIHDSYACRKGKGVHKGVLRLQQFIRKITSNGIRPAFYIQLDIKNYFMSIDKEILFSLVARKTKDDTALWLARALIFHDCTKDYVFKGDAELLKSIPPHKTLFHTPKDKGLPVGNLNSQFFANIYLNGLDQFVKHCIKCQYYIRYCDDFVLLSPDRNQLLEWRENIVQYLGRELKLELNHNRQRLQPVSNGINFLGYIVREDYLLVRRRVVNNLHTRLRKFESLLLKEGRYFRRYLFDEAILDKLTATIASYLGHFRMANTYSLCCSLWARYPFLKQYYKFDMEKRKLESNYKHPRGFRKIRSQYFYYRCKFHRDVLFFQVGSFFEFYHEADRKTAQFLSLMEMKENKRGALYGFPVNKLNGYLRMLLGDGRSVILIFEREQYWTRIKERLPRYRFEYIKVDIGTFLTYKLKDEMDVLI